MLVLINTTKNSTSGAKKSHLKDDLILWTTIPKLSHIGELEVKPNLSVSLVLVNGERSSI
jgi:hypothetical protein